MAQDLLPLLTCQGAEREPGVSQPRRRACLLGAAAIVAAPLLGACGERGGRGASAFKGIDITGAEYANALSLPDTEGRVRTLADFQGKVAMVFFGFTQCPDVCPTTMAELAEVKRRLGPDGERVLGVFVTIDPARDTPELLRSYVSSFDAGFIALRGTDEQTATAARNFKVFYAKVPGKSEDSYTMDHTAGAYLFDPQGRVRVFTRYGTGPDALQHDLRQLLGGA